MCVVKCSSRFSKRQSFGRLSQSSILIRAHFHADTLQDLFNPHVAVPVSHGRQFFRLDGTRFRIDAIHVDFGHEADFGRDRGIFLGAMNSQLVKSAVMLGLKKVQNTRIVVGSEKMRLETAPMEATHGG